MGRISRKIEAIFAAVAFAEQGEWDEAIRIADGSLRHERIMEQAGIDRTPASQAHYRRPRPRL
ncbi:MAG: hypothetical protein N839_0014560 [Desulfofustis sp. PB-SRB1]|jgi:hypothetical protein|nr:hypothetical protein [Desulfofustis sp. PB-SRB1]MBM1003616.1 hypothetical protein [Desulfofustis sp. PB-SRB1]HBH29784.1 hypothetical protein [Desulfofustis sp.]HBH32735.1 hypothetical protein [Desulfofustis sp.]